MSNTPSPMQNGAADHAIAGVAAPNWGALRHSANEWADMAINGLQWLRNIVDGASDAKSALENMEGNLAHCRAVNDAPDVQFAIRAASAAVSAAHAGQPVSSLPSGSSFDHKTASAILANRPVCGDALRRFVASARWEHDARHSMSLMIADLRRELGAREAEIALLKEALLLAEGAAVPQVKYVQLIQQMLDALENAKAFIDDAHILEGQWHWKPVETADAAIGAARAVQERKA